MEEAYIDSSRLISIRADRSLRASIWQNVNRIENNPRSKIILTDAIKEYLKPLHLFYRLHKLEDALEQIRYTLSEIGKDEDYIQDEFDRELTEQEIQ
jgi:hypothetical protein